MNLDSAVPELLTKLLMASVGEVISIFSANLQVAMESYSPQLSSPYVFKTAENSIYELEAEHFAFMKPRRVNYLDI
ncbi:hypothetical protein LIER_02698 [Lithospermum erythrorhizon]|uniref:Uncharacterized protein n=1 Tax=Lithospermum erythrorhizon TaxID=34254 RepID=A0AAV3NRX2_LITER